MAITFGKSRRGKVTLLDCSIIFALQLSWLTVNKQNLFQGQALIQVRMAIHRNIKRK